MKEYCLINKVPLLFVDVNIDENQTARITIYENDKCEDLANAFAL